MGLLTYELYISLNHKFISGETDEEFIKREVEFLKNVLPKGTEFLDKTPDNSRCLYSSDNAFGNSYILTFGHPYFKNGTKLEVERERIAWEEKNSIHKSDMFIGLRYITPMVYPVNLISYPITRMIYPVNLMAHLDDVGAPISLQTSVDIDEDEDE